MKKVLLTLATMLLLFTSCTKNEAKLSDFVVGNWKSQELTLGDSPLGYFTATINSDYTYVLKFTLSDGSQSITCSKVGYTIDEKNSKITIVSPTFDPNTPATGTNTFSVTWTVGGNKMTWTPDNTTDGTPTLSWTRQ